MDAVVRNASAAALGASGNGRSSTWNAALPSNRAAHVDGLFTRDEHSNTSIGERGNSCESANADDGIDEAIGSPADDGRRIRSAGEAPTDGRAAGLPATTPADAARSQPSICAVSAASYGSVASGAFAQMTTSCESATSRSAAAGGSAPLAVAVAATGLAIHRRSTVTSTFVSVLAVANMPPHATSVSSPQAIAPVTRRASAGVRATTAIAGRGCGPRGGAKPLLGEATPPRAPPPAAGGADEAAGTKGAAATNAARLDGVPPGASSIGRPPRAGGAPGSGGPDGAGARTRN